MKNMAPLQIDTVNGQVAHSINNHGPINFGPPRHPTAADRLFELMPRACHAELNWLLDHSDLTAKDLLGACNSSALICRDGKLIRQFVKLDYSAGTFFTAFMLSWFIVFSIVSFTQNLDGMQKLTVWGSLSVITLCIYFVAKQYFWPQLIARKAIKALLAAH